MVSVTFDGLLGEPDGHEVLCDAVELGGAFRELFELLLEGVKVLEVVGTLDQRLAVVALHIVLRRLRPPKQYP